jgi:hypothetical protein
MRTAGSCLKRVPTLLPHPVTGLQIAPATCMGHQSLPAKTPGRGSYRQRRHLQGDHRDKERCAGVAMAAWCTSLSLPRGRLCFCTDYVPKVHKSCFQLDEVNHGLHRATCNLVICMACCGTYPYPHTNEHNWVREACMCCSVVYGCGQRALSTSVHNRAGCCVRTVGSPRIGSD